MYLFGSFAATRNQWTKPFIDIKKGRVFPAVLGYATVTPICVFYAMYIAVQFNYFTAAFGGTLPEEYSYAAYARKGFFELCTVAVINLCVIAGMNLFLKRKEDGTPSVAMKVYCTLLSGFTVLLIVSALSKMVLYIKEMGMTPLRIYTSWFMLVLGVVFIIELVREIKPSIPAVKLQIAGFSVMLALLCFCDPDARIAQNNVEGYLSGKYETVDIYSMYDLSESALPSIAKLPEDDKNVKGYLSDYKESLNQKIENSVYFPVSIPAVNAQNYLSDR